MLQPFRLRRLLVRVLPFQVARAACVHRSHFASTSLPGWGFNGVPRTSPPVTRSDNPFATCAKAAHGSTMSQDELPYRYRWPRPAVTVDCLIYALRGFQPNILLIRRKHDPCMGSWALPGGFVDENEGLEVAAQRELEEETSVKGCPMVQTGAYGDPGRDPRGHTVTVAFMGWVPSVDCGVRAADDAADARFFPITRLPPMAFDHMQIIKDAWARCVFRSFGGRVYNLNLGESGPSGIHVLDKATEQELHSFETAGEGFGGVEPLSAALGTIVPFESAQST